MAASLLGAHNILTVTDSGGLAIFKTAAPHGLDGGSSIVTTGVTPSGYNQAGVPGLVSPTEFQLGSFSTPGSGGRWDFEV